MKTTFKTDNATDSQNTTVEGRSCGECTQKIIVINTTM